MAPWYPGATPTGFLGLRWASDSNRDSIYTCLNNINTAKFRTFEEYGELVGHDNFNYIVSTWTHKFTESGSIHTNTEAYYMWQFDAHVGGTSSVAPRRTSSAAAGLGRRFPATPRPTACSTTPSSSSRRRTISPSATNTGLIRRASGPVSPTPTRATAIGLSHNFNDLYQIRPEVGYYRGYWQPAFDDGQKMGEWIIGFDSTIRF